MAVTWRKLIMEGDTSWVDLTDGGETTLHKHPDTGINFTDVTTGNVSTTAHGYAPKAVAPASPTLNYLGIANGETSAAWKSASSNPGAAAAVLQTDAAGGISLSGPLTMPVGYTPIYLGTGVGAPRVQGIWTNAVAATLNYAVNCNAGAFTTRGDADLDSMLTQYYVDTNYCLMSLYRAAAGGTDGATVSFGNPIFLFDLKTSTLKIGGALTAVRSTTLGTNQIELFNGTAPAGTLSNGGSIYCSSGELYTMDAAGNATLQTPHDDEGNWIFYSRNTVTGRVLRIDMERMMKAINDRFGWDFVKEYATDVPH